jgi:hypothetical protein
MLLTGKRMLPFIFNITIGWIKPSFYWFISVFLAFLSGKFISIFQSTPQISSVWYESPAFVGGAVAGVFLILKQILDWYKENRKDQKASEDENDKRQITFTEKIQELTHAERKDLLGGLMTLHEKEVEMLETKFETEVKFWKREFAIKSKGEFEARMRAHRFGNEVNRLNAHVFILHASMSKASLDIPAFELKSYDQLMEGIDAEVEKHQSSLSERHDRSKRKTS